MQWEVDYPISFRYQRWPVMGVLEFSIQKSPEHLSRFHWRAEGTVQVVASRSLREGDWAGQGKILPWSGWSQQHQGGEYTSWWRRDTNDKEKVMNEVRCWESRNKSESRKVRGKAFCIEFTRDTQVALWHGNSPEKVEAMWDQVPGHQSSGPEWGGWV